MEKEIGEGKRICIGVIGPDLEESTPLRKVITSAIVTNDR